MELSAAADFPLFLYNQLSFFAVFETMMKSNGLLNFELAERQQRLGKMLNKLRRYANIYNIAVVITNQVVSYPDGSRFGYDFMKAAGGNIMGHGSTYRIFLRVDTLVTSVPNQVHIS